MTDEKPLKISKKLDDQMNEMMKAAFVMAFMYPMMKVLGYVEVVEEKKEKDKKEDVVTTKN